MKLNVSRLQKQKVLTDHVQIIANMYKYTSLQQIDIIYDLGLIIVIIVVKYLGVVSILVILVVISWRSIHLILLNHCGILLAAFS